MTQPLVSIITPSLNAAAFLEDTVRSVLTQDYPRIEYLVMDGGSVDGTLDILQSYGSRLTYVSKRDSGTADAINQGFTRARGEIVAWLSADDTYLPGAISRAVEALTANSDAAAVYGEGYWTGLDGEMIGRYPTGPGAHSNLDRECRICQPACFMRRNAVESVGMLNPALRASFDYDLWIRLTLRYPFVYIPADLATSRMHRENKTIGQRRTVFTESIALLERHYGYVPLSWIYGYLSFLRDGRDQFFDPLQHSPTTYLLSLPVGIRRNYRRPIRYFSEWLSAITPLTFRRLWSQTAS